MTERGIPAAEYSARLERLREGMSSRLWEAVYVASPANLAYFAGVSLTPLERLAALVVPRDRHPSLVVPSLEAEAATENQAGVSVLSWTDTEGPVGCLQTALGQVKGRRLALEKDAVTVRVLELMQGILGESSFDDASPLVMDLRTRKSPAELAAISRAATVLDDCLAELPERLRPGRTEAEMAFEIDSLVRHHGGEGTPFETIVLGGPNAAFPHGRPGRRELREGDLVIVDFGTVRDGYCADVTRTFALGEPGGRAREIFELVREAQTQGCQAVRAGAVCSHVDAAARNVIESGGYGEYFVHRTGHGLGLDIHEPPFLVAGSDRRLEAGNVVTVEPGIYLPGVLGVRIEDDVAVGEDGSMSLTKARHDLIVCPP